MRQKALALICKKVTVIAANGVVKEGRLHVITFRPLVLSVLDITFALDDVQDIMNECITLEPWAS